MHHVKRIKQWPRLGDLVIRNSATHKKYVVVGFDTDFKSGRFGAMEKDRDVVILRYLGEFYADERQGKKPKASPYRRIDLKQFDWEIDYRNFTGSKMRISRYHNHGYSVVVRMVGEYVRGTTGLAL